MTRWTRRPHEDGFEEGILDRDTFMAATERALAHEEDRAVVLIDLSGRHWDLDGEEAETGGLWSALVAAAESRTARTIRPGDLLGRLEEGQLAVLTGPEGGREGAGRVAMRLADRLGEPINVGGRELMVRPRIGVAQREGIADTAEAMLQRAAMVAR